jgi:heme/copper-type cytochrome/quinol oxidase subunit 2
VAASGLMAGCAHPNAPECHEPPPTDGYILFWTPILIATLLVGLIATSYVIWRYRRRRG